MWSSSLSARPLQTLCDKTNIWTNIPVPLSCFALFFGIVDFFHFFESTRYIFQFLKIRDIFSNFWEYAKLFQDLKIRDTRPRKSFPFRYSAIFSETKFSDTNTKKCFKTKLFGTFWADQWPGPRAMTMTMTMTLNMAILAPVPSASLHVLFPRTGWWIPLKVRN